MGPFVYIRKTESNIMYRNITYNINKAANWRGEVRIDTWDDDGKPITRIEPHKSWLYYEHPNGTHTSIFDTKVMKKEFNSSIERSRWIKGNPGRRIFESLPPIQEYLMDQFGGFQEEQDFQMYPLHAHSLDIEVAGEDEFPYPDKAEYPINLITCKRFYASADALRYSELDKFNHDFVFVASAAPYTPPKREDRTYFVFDSEVEMLRAYVRWHHANYPDLITGWNTDGFDIPYITNRIRKILGEAYVALLSPILKVRPKNMKVKDRNTEVISYTWEGITIIDYMHLYKYKFQVKRPYFNLDFIGKKELNIGKKPYEGSIKEFWKNNFPDFVEYNIHDANIVYLLDRKLNFLSLARLMCNIGLCSYESIYKSAPYIFGAIVLQSRLMDRVVLSSTGEDTSDEEYEGAFVFEPVVGYYNKGAFSFDLDSLYPNIIIMCNISPETKVGKVVIDIDGRARVTIHGRETIFPDEAAFDKAIDGKLIRSANNILYVVPSSRKGVIPAFLERHYDERRKIKNEGKEFEKEALKQTDKAKKEEFETKAKLKDLYQNARKVMLNTTYGQLGSKYFPLFDIDNAEAITITGQKIIKTAAAYIDERIAAVATSFLDLSPNGKVGAIGGDTDSVYVNGEVLMRHALGGRRPDFKSWADIYTVNKYLGNFASEVNQVLADRIQLGFCHSPLRRLNFKLESIADCLAYLKKKNYVMHSLLKEGVEQYADKEQKKMGKFKYVGVSIQKNELPDAIKDVLKDFVENGMLEGWDSKKYNERLTYYWNIYSKMAWSELSFIATYGSHKDAEGFLEFAKGTHYVLKAVLTYNQLLKKMGISQKYMESVINDKVRLCYINKDNQYDVECMAWTGELPDEMKKIFCIDYELMFEKTILKKLKAFEIAFGWKRNQVLNDYEIALDDL